MSKGCYTCRRRRIICDNGLPTCRKCRDAGKECLGYQKPLVWVKGGVASRGKMMGRSFGDDKKDKIAAQRDEGTGQSAGVASLSGEAPSSSTNTGQTLETTQPASQQAVESVNAVQTPWVLVDPLFQDYSRVSRFYINHCTSKRHWSNCLGY